ncbi:MAG: hypothetical protein O2999_14240 [Nitrospirae bacterium]|nr:hypothetical protein [Nitrospirota bacterium]MDA1305422.1 hypothetical protein [Nitrospirota bacterium]
MPTDTTPLIRKQYLVSQRNVSKLERLAKHKKTSATAIVREAIDAYDPEGFDALKENELMALVSARLKEAIHDTRSTRKKLNKTLKELGAV